MEFKFRAVDNKPATTSFPLSSVTYVSDRLRRGAGGFSGMPNTFRVPVAGDALRRELEKEQIRREIIAGEIARRRELEEEVRRELALERALGIPMQRCLAAPFSFQERVATLSNPLMNPVAVENIIGASQPQIVAPVEIKSSPQVDNNKVIMLAKPKSYLYSAKQKAVTPAIDGTEPSEFGLKKKPKAGWSCALCQVSGTSERGLNDHLHGKKHKAKEVAMRTQKIGKSTEASFLSNESEKGMNTAETILATTSGLDAKADRLLPQPCITLEELNQTMVDKNVMESKNEEEEEQLVQKSQNEGGLENQNGTETEEAGKTTNSLTQLQLPQIVAHVEITPPQIDMDNVIASAKPDPDLYNAKRKAVAPAVSETQASAFSLQKKPRKEWSCALCQVSATSERGLNNHLHGRKHKAKEAALRTQKIGKSTTEASLLSKEGEKSVNTTDTILTTTSGLDAKADRQSPQSCITLEELNRTMVDKGVMESKNEEELVIDIGGLENQNGTETEEAGKTNALTKRKVTLWCEICQIHTFSQVVMEAHKKGKKHLRQMKEFCQNNAGVPPTSSISQEAPGLIKDTDVVNKETDQMITHVVKEETMLKVAEIFSNSDEVHSVAESRGDKANGGL